MYQSHYFLGMDLLWWGFWCIVLVSFFIFFVPVLRKNVRNTPIDNLQRRFSKGEMSIYEYEQRKRFLEKDEDLKRKMFFLFKLNKP